MVVRPWTFVVIDTDGINAFAAPGGYIFLTKGLISILSTEDELALNWTRNCSCSKKTSFQRNKKTKTY